MEEQGSAGGAERQIAKLVEDDEIGVGEPGCDLSWFALKLLLFKSVDQFDGGEEADALAVVLDRLDADRSGETRSSEAFWTGAEGFLQTTLTLLFKVESRLAFRAWPFQR